MSAGISGTTGTTTISAIEKSGERLVVDGGARVHHDDLVRLERPRQRELDVLRGDERRERRRWRRGEDLQAAGVLDGVRPEQLELVERRVVAGELEERLFGLQVEV